MDGMDIDIALLVKLRKFLEECMAGFCSMECNGTLAFPNDCKGEF
jgi:hypothetical protein